MINTANVVRERIQIRLCYQVFHKKYRVELSLIAKMDAKAEKQCLQRRLKPLACLLHLVNGVRGAVTFVKRHDVNFPAIGQHDFGFG